MKKLLKSVELSTKNAMIVDNKNNNFKNREEIKNNRKIIIKILKMGIVIINLPVNFLYNTFLDINHYHEEVYLIH